MGKYVDFTQGAVTGILAGLAQLNCSELTLKQLEFKQGVLGLDKLAALAATAWLADIRSSQLPALLGGSFPHFLPLSQNLDQVWDPCMLCCSCWLE